MQWDNDAQHYAMWAIFALTYLGIALGRLPRLVIDRTGIAILGGIAMLLVHGTTIRGAAAHIDYETVLLLFALMVFSAQLRVAGFYTMTGQFLNRLLDRPRFLLALLIGVSGLLSALLANDIVCLAFTPLICIALLGARRDPLPYLLALAMSSNIGSAATLIGNPQNMYIGTVAKLPFGHYTLTMLPPTLLALALLWVGVLLVYGRRLHAPPTGERPPYDLRAGDTLAPTSLPLQTAGQERDLFLIVKTLVLLALLVVAFLTVQGEHRTTCALAGAGVLLLSHRAKAARLYQLVDWNLILLFLGLFVVNGAMAERGLTTEAFERLRSSGLNLQHLGVFSAVTLGLSNLVSNVPAVMLLKPTVAPDDARTWYLLALVSTWAGNLTLVGSIANLIVAESASAFGVRVDLRTYCRLGIPLTLLTVALGVTWLLLVM
jgi:Na+/H+ antiporter NhaD/arsenite permease-like protein